MTVTRHELRQGKTAFIIWTGAIAFLMAVCVVLYPQMKGEMDGLTDMFSSMGSFTAAFGLDRLSFGSLTGYYAIVCGNVLGLGGASSRLSPPPPCSARRKRTEPPNFC